MVPPAHAWLDGHRLPCARRGYEPLLAPAIRSCVQRAGGDQGAAVGPGSTRRVFTSSTCLRCAPQRLEHNTGNNCHPFQTHIRALHSRFVLVKLQQAATRQTVAGFTSIFSTL